MPLIVAARIYFAVPGLLYGEHLRASTEYRRRAIAPHHLPMITLLVTLQLIAEMSYLVRLLPRTISFTSIGMIRAKRGGSRMKSPEPN